MPTFPVVLDACVLYPAALRDRLLRAARAGLYQARWSDAILEEARRNLVEDERMNEERGWCLIDKMREAFPTRAMLAVIEAQASALQNSPLTVAEVPDEIARNAPRFAALVRARLAAS